MNTSNASTSAITPLPVPSPERRAFLQTSALSGAGLMLGVAWNANAPEAHAAANLAPTVLSDKPVELVPFIHIAPNGHVTLFNPRPDMGQGTWQSVPAMLAEELCISLDNVTIRQTEGAKKHGNQNSGGSSSIRRLWKPIRTAAAAAREMLIAAAAAQWGVPASECVAENGMVVHRPQFGKESGLSVVYGSLVEAASKLEVPKEPRLKSPEEFTIIGKPLPRADVPLKVDGSAQFGIDVKVPNMLYATVERAPTILGTVVSFDDKAARAVKGVQHVVKSLRPTFGKPLEGVAVLATSYWAAVQGRKALQVQWKAGSEAAFTTAAFYEAMRSAAKANFVTMNAPSSPRLQRGNAKHVIEQARATPSQFKHLEAVYETPFLAHAPMEPENVVAHVQGDKVEIWAPTQGPVWTINAVATEFKFAPENVTVHPTFLGGSFGRKGGLDDFVLEAVHLSKTVGAPVKLIWSREDDITQGPFRPGMVSGLQGVLDAAGNLVAFHHTVVAPSIRHQTDPLPPNKVDESATEAIDPEGSPYTIPNMEIQYIHAQAPMPVMWWRSVYASTNVFGHESFMDELARAAGKDPLVFRLELLDKSRTASLIAARFHNVLTTLAEKSRWYDALPKGEGRGMAVARSFESIAAHAVTVGRGADGKLRVQKVVVVLDCGMYVNPDTVKAQTEGNVVMGLTAALNDAITFNKGVAEQRNFDTYRMLTISDTPAIEVHIIQNRENPGGVGEPGLPPLAPALANAVFDATGKRIRVLPFALDAV
jgi:isoquinoline 1-oxidoreductase beta subunit